MDLQCCNYCHVPSDFSSRFQSSMTIYLHKLLARRQGFGQWTNSSTFHNNIFSFNHEKFHLESYHSDIKYHMTLNIIFSVPTNFVHREHRHSNVLLKHDHARSEALSEALMISTISKRMTDKSVNVDMYLKNHFRLSLYSCRAAESSSIFCGELSVVWWWRIKAVCELIMESRQKKTLAMAQENALVFTSKIAKRNRYSAGEAI